MKDASSRKLPRLNPAIRLYPSSYGADGQPHWTLHNPVSGEFFRIEWAAFECLARFGHYDTSAQLIQAVNHETTLTVDETDVHSLITFLQDKGLLELSEHADQMPQIKEEGQKPWWHQALHGYLFFTVPLVKPDAFLDKALPYVRPVLSKPFVMLMLANLVLAFVMLLPRIDGFLATFTDIFTLQGAVMALVVFAFLKVVHELAHAFTAKKYGVQVPHMGVAFIVLYPVLYTETTASWQLSSRRQRFHIGVAGILAELCLAGIFLWLWQISPEGSVAQNISFLAIVIALLGSLLVNLNPLMRFDGYYMLCDITGLDNLQHRACAFARQALRRFLFADQSGAPEPLPARTQRFLTWFGFALLIYRFFLFLGIAILVYWLFPKPLGAILMAVELLYFIGFPIWSELKVWAHKLPQYKSNPRAYMTLAVAVGLLILMAVPWERHVHMPATLHAAQYEALYPAAVAYVQAVNVKDGQRVEKGQVLLRLTSDQLQHDINKAQQELAALELQRRRFATSRDDSGARMGRLERQIALQAQKLATLQTQAKGLIVKAPFDGIVKDMHPLLHEGRYVPKTMRLMQVIAPEKWQVTAYGNAQDRRRLHIGDKAVFRTGFALRNMAHLQLTQMAETKADRLAFPELLSVYGGPIAARAPQGPETIELVQGIFPIYFSIIDINPQLATQELPLVVKGSVQAYGQAESLLARLGRGAANLLRRESGLN